MPTNSPQFVHSFLAHKDGTTSASFSPDGSTLATGGYDCLVRLWEVGTWQEKQILPGHRRGHVAYAPDGYWLISGGLHKDAVIFDAKTWEVEATLEDVSGVWGIAIGPEGCPVIIIEPDGYSEEGQWKPLELWDAQEWRLIKTVGIGTEDVYSAAYAPDGKSVAVTTYGGMVGVWNADFTIKTSEFSAHDKAAWGMAFAPDEKTLATGGADKIVRLWDTSTWKMLHELAPVPIQQSNSVLCVTFSSDGQWLAAGNLDGNLSIWHL